MRRILILLLALCYFSLGLTAIAEENAASTQQTTASANEFAALVGNIKDETVTLKQIAEVIDKSVGQFQL